MELEAALTDMLERKDEAERDGEDDEEAEVSSPEPQIVPVGGGGGGLRRLSPQSERKRERELAEKRADRPIDFHIRQNPFNDLLDDCSRGESMGISWAFFDLLFSEEAPYVKSADVYRFNLMVI